MFSKKLSKENLKNLFPFIKKFFGPNKFTLIIFVLLITLALTPGIGYWKSEYKIEFHLGGNYCALLHERNYSEYKDICIKEFHYWKLNKILWPVNLITFVTSENGVIYADSSAEFYNQPTATEATEFIPLYFSSYLKEIDIHLNEFKYVNKFSCLAEHIIPGLLKPVILIIYWYLLACVIAILLSYLYFHYKKNPKINLLTKCSLFMVSILLLMYGFHLAFFVPALEEAKHETISEISWQVRDYFIHYFPDRIPVGREIRIENFSLIPWGIVKGFFLILIGSILFVWSLYKLVLINQK